jgi:FAD dependent oxidoreductase
VALAVLEQLLAPHVSGHQLIVLRRHKAVSAVIHSDSVKAVTVRSLDSGDNLTLSGQLFIDATEMGDLLPMTRTEYVTGFESQRETQDPHAPPEAQPRNIQSFTCCFAIDYLAGEHHTIDKPEEYDFWKNYSPQLRPAWPGKLLSWAHSHPITLQPRTMMIDPLHEDEPGKGGFWKYRRIADRRNFVEGTYKGDICLVNWPQNDYWLGNLIDVSEGEAQNHLRRAKQLSLSLLYWMQTEAPRTDGGAGWPGLRLRRDIVGTEDGLAKHPYIRESRRIKAEFTVLEQHVGTEARIQLTGKSREEVTAESFHDSIGIGSYRIDPPSEFGWRQLHRCQLPALSNPTRGAHSAASREPAAWLQEPGCYPHHEWLLPVAPRRMEYWRSSWPACGLCSETKEKPTPDPQSKTVAFRFSEVCTRPGSRN